MQLYQKIVYFSTAWGRLCRNTTWIQIKMLRKQILITEPQNDYLRSLSEATGESEGHIIRQAIDLHAKHFDLSSIPALTYEEKPPTTEDQINEPEP